MPGALAGGPTSAPTTVPTTAPAPTTPPLRYNRAAFPTLKAPDPALDLTAIKAALKPRLKSYSVTALPAAAPKDAELFLYYLIYELSNKDNWGSEMDVVAPIERPAKAGDPPPKARATVRIDQDGNASAELVATGPIPEPPQATFAAAKPKLISDFGFADVKDDGTATWSDAEISDVAEALTLLPTADKTALKGVELIRVKDLAGGFAGEFSTAGGTTGPGNTAVKALPWLKLADKAFEHRTVQFYGGPKRTVPASFDVILHEVGHAVEKEVYRGAEEAYTQALIDSNKKLIPKNTYAKEHKKQTADYTALYGKWSSETNATKKAEYATRLKGIKEKRDEVYKKYEAAEKPYQIAHILAETKEKEVPKTRVSAATVVKPLEAEAATAKTAAASALATTKSRIALLKPDLIASCQPWVDALDAVAKEIQAFATGAAGGDIEDLENKVIAEVKKRNDARDAVNKAAPAHPELASLDLAASAQDAWFTAERTAARAPKRTLRVQKFVDLVITNKIAPFTDYAKKNWPHKPEEFYAEAYALWRTDPDFLSNNYPPVFTFFEGGDYQK